jgi:hypothetical protein
VLPPNLFDLIAPDYREWRRMAESLKTGAVAVAEDWGQRMVEKFRPGTVSLSNLADLYSEPHVATLLAGLAIENLAKGLVIRREGLDHGELPKGLDKHETLTYLDRGKFKLSADERRLVKRLEEYVVWAGRYPVPKRRGFNMRRGAGMNLSEQQFLKLYERLRKELL